MHVEVPLGVVQQRGPEGEAKARNELCPGPGGKEERGQVLEAEELVVRGEANCEGAETFGSLDMVQGKAAPM